MILVVPKLAQALGLGLVLAAGAALASRPQGHLSHALTPPKIVNAKTIASLRLLADSARASGDFARATKAKLELLAIIAQSTGEDSLAYAAALQSAAVDLQSDGRIAEAVRLLKHAVNIRVARQGAPPSEMAKAMTALAAAYAEQGRFTDAEPLFQRALAIWQTDVGRNRPAMAETLSKFGEFYSAQSKYNESAAQLAAALKIQIEELGKDDFATVHTEAMLALAYIRLGRGADADPLFKQALNAGMIGEAFDGLWSATGLIALTEWYRAHQYYRTVDQRLVERSVANPAQFGVKAPARAEGMHRLAQHYLCQGRFDDAEALMKHAVAIFTESLGPDHLATARTLNDLALLYDAQTRWNRSEPLFNRVLAIYQQSRGASDPGTIQAKANLAGHYRASGQFAKALRLRTDVLVSTQLLYGETSRVTADAMRSLAEVERADGRYAPAERLLKRSLAITDNINGLSDPASAATLSELARVYRAQGRSAEAETLLQRAITIRKQAFGPDNLLTVKAMNNLAEIYREEGQLDAAEALYRRSLAVRELALGENHRDTATALGNLASLLGTRRNFAEAERLYRRSIVIRTKILGPNHPEVANSLVNMARLYGTEDRFSDAETALRNATRILTPTLGPNHPDMLVIQRDLAFDLLSQPERSRLALAPARGAVNGIRRRGIALGSSLGDEMQMSRDRELQQSYFTLLADAAWSSSQARPQDLSRLRLEAFNALQEAMAGTTSQALALAAARRAAANLGNDLGKLASDRQSLADQWRVTDEQFNAALGRSDATTVTTRSALAQRQANLEAKLAIIDETLRTRYPKYFALTRPQPLGLAEAQRLLGPHEATLMIVPTHFGTHLMLLTRERLVWRRVPITAEQVQASVGRLRRDLSPSGVIRAAETNRDAVARGNRSYDRATAYALYKALISPLLPVLSGKTTLFIASSGALTSLPLGVLVTAVPQGDDADPQTLRATPWLGDAYALVQLPSIQSLAFLRNFVVRAGKPEASGARAPISFIGFGDPELAAEAAAPALAEPAPSPSSQDDLDSDHGVIVDPSRLRTLPQLRGTKVELEQLQSLLGASETALYLDARDTETNVRTIKLESYRIIAFATHGVLGGEIPGVTEAGLVFTPPERPSAADDGYLAASEVATLRLNADWVILSACNTAVGMNRGAPGLSGLARSFFYAGARNLLASYWPVRDDIAARISADTIARRQANPGLSRARALQLTIRDIRNSPADPSAAHPSVWAPFSLIGDGQ